MKTQIKFSLTLRDLLCIIVVFSTLQCTVIDSSHYSGKDNSTNKRVNQERMRGEDGSCYAKSRINGPKKEYLEVYVYNGDERNPPGVEQREFVTRPASTRWVKKKSNKPCKSSDPEDCMVWCMEEVKEEKMNVMVVVDTLVNKKFDKELIVLNDVIKGESFEWREVLCPEHVTTSFVQELKLKLIEEGLFDVEKLSESKELNKEVLLALKRYQQKYQLPIGSLNIETIDHLGIQ